MTDSTLVPDDQLLELRRTARQLVFRTGVDSTPVSLGGTCFLLGYRDRLFAITARHVVKDAVPEELLLATSEDSWIPARVLEQFNPSDEISGALDLVVYDLDVRHFIAKHRRNSRAYNLLATESNWSATRYQSNFFFFGYPLVHATVDYGSRTTRAESQQWFLQATYQGSSELPHCHKLRLLDASGIGDLNGLSGSPVFACRSIIGTTAQPQLAGILLRGTAASGLVHFLEVEALRTVLEEILRRPPRRLPKRWRSVKTKKRRAPREHH